MKQRTDAEYNTVSRREFFKSFVSLKTGLLSKEPDLEVVQAVPQRFALNALKDLPEHMLRQMVPVLRRDLTATIQNDVIAFRGEGGEEGSVPLRQEACAAVRLFDGLLTMEQIGSTLEIEQVAEPGNGFLLAREAFLALSARGIYHPSGPPPENRPPEPVDKAGVIPFLNHL